MDGFRRALGNIFRAAISAGRAHVLPAVKQTAVNELKQLLLGGGDPKRGPKRG